MYNFRKRKPGLETERQKRGHALMIRNRAYRSTRNRKVRVSLSKGTRDERLT